MTSSDKLPPRWATRLLELYCAPHLLEEVQGDLLEEYKHRCKRDGVFRAKVDYIRSVLGFMKPFAIRRKKSPHSHQIPFMNLLRHYLVVAFRNCIRHKSFSAINIVGLALGMTCCLFIYLWVQDEKGVDNFHAKGDDIYVAYETIKSGQQTMSNYSSPLKFYQEHVEMTLHDVQHTVPEIEHVVFYATAYELPWGHSETFQVGEKMYKLEGSRASEDFFTMFSYPVIAGDPKTALKDIHSVAISRKMSDLFFASPQDAIGKTFRHENTQDFTVTAVFENVTAQSTLKFDYLMTWEAQLKLLQWSSPVNHLYVQLKKNADVEKVAVSMTRYQATRLEKDRDYEMTLGLQKYGDRYLNGNLVNGKPNGGRIEYVRIFSGVAIFI